MAEKKRPTSNVQRPTLNEEGVAADQGATVSKAKGIF
jgi:hypothetical protein